MITSNGKQSTSSAAAKTLLQIPTPGHGWLKVWTFNAASGAGKIYFSIDGGTAVHIEVDAGEFADSFPIKFNNSLHVYLVRGGATDMADWQASFNRTHL
jgi:hypothetical protein